MPGILMAYRFRSGIAVIMPVKKDAEFRD